MITTESLLRALTTSALLAFTLAPGRARADDASDRAEGLFQEAKVLMEQGRYPEACPKLAEAQALHGGGGTLLALGLCHEGENRLGTALVELREAHELAVRAARKDRADLADEHIRSIEARVSRVLLAGRPRPDVSVTLDGVAVRAEQWNNGVPVDGGTHTVGASAPGKRPWERKIDVQASGQTARVEVPELEALPAVRPVPTFPPTPTRSSARVPFLVTGGSLAVVGAVGLGVGAYFGFRALDQHAASQLECAGTVCNDVGYRLNDDARRSARIADVALGAGGVLAVTGVVFLVVGARLPRSDALAVQPLVGPSTMGAALSGSF
jgi:hypothetical protein